MTSEDKGITICVVTFFVVVLLISGGAIVAEAVEEHEKPDVVKLIEAAENAED